MGPNYPWRKNKLFCARGGGAEEAAMLEGGAVWGGPGKPEGNRQPRGTAKDMHVEGNTLLTITPELI